MKLVQQLLLVMTAILIVSSVHAQKWEHGDVEEEDRNVGEFTAIAVSHGIDVIITQGNSSKVHVKASSNAIDKLVTEVENGTLKIYYDKKVRRVKKADVYVTVDELKGINASGGSDVESKGVLTYDELKLNSSGGSDMELELDVENLYVNISGGADIELAGTGKYLKLNASGGSDFDGYDYKVEEATIHASGGSDSNVYVSQSIDVHASGASDVNFKGNPKQTKLKSSGASDIHSYK